jgi:hypothetical protein
MNPRNDKNTRQYTFGELSFSITGLGVFFGGSKLDSKIAELTFNQICAANRDAWKQRKRLESEQRRKSNVSIHGWNDSLEAHLDVAAAVCKATFKAMKNLS